MDDSCVVTLKGASMILYNIFTEGANYRVTKWDESFNVEASYVVSSSSCDCPSRSRPCKHVSLVGQAIAEQKVNTQYFFEPDTAHWHLIIPKELDHILSFKPYATWRRM